MFGECICFMPPPQEFYAGIDDSDDISLTWEKPIDSPDGYNIYMYFDDEITKLNDDLVEEESYVYTPASPGIYNFFIKAVYTIRGFQHEGTNSEFIEIAYFLPTLIKVNALELIIADARDSENADYQTTIGQACAKEYGEDEYTIEQTDIDITVGEVTGDWYGNGTTIVRTYEDAKRHIVQTITVEERRITIQNEITYSDTVQIEYEGFKFTGHTDYSKIYNVYGTGTGQHIITNTGMFFHNGDYTYHKVLADIQENQKWKTYIDSYTESCIMYLMDGRDFKPARILLQPNGYNSSFVIGDHPDGSTEKSERAVFYGVSNTEDAEYKSEGMAIDGILGDWGVFAKPIVGVTAFVDDDDYLDLLLEVKNDGHQIIPHSTSADQDHRAEVILYLPLYKEYFACSSWIDHSLGGGNITLGINSKGWDITDDENYMMDIFEENGFNKAWAYRDFDQDRITDGTWGFNHDVAYFNDNLKMPSENSVLLFTGSNRPFYNGWLNINELIENNGSIDSHDYLRSSARRADANTDSFRYTHYIDGEDYRTTDGFNLICEQIADKKNSGEIWNPTGTDFYEYFKKVRLVQMELIDEDTMSLNNTGDIINGFTIIIYRKDAEATLNGVAMSNKQAKNGTILWGNLASGNNEIIIL